MNKIAALFLGFVVGVTCTLIYVVLKLEGLDD